MAEYIERDLVLKEVEPDYRPQLARRINEIPAADVAPVVRGKWVYNPRDAIEMMFTLPKCSICGHETSDALHYCPNCGAKMEEVPADGD